MAAKTMHLLVVEIVAVAVVMLYPRETSFVRLMVGAAQSPMVCISL
jgi:hypothetical protein